MANDGRIVRVIGATGQQGKRPALLARDRGVQHLIRTPTGSASPLWAIVAAALLHLVFVLSLVFGFLNPLFFEATHTHGQAGDFFGIYQAGVNVCEGRSIYARLERGDQFTLSVPYYYFYRYAPPTALAFAPLTGLLPPRPAYWAWVALNEILLLVLAARVLGLREGTIGRRAVAAALWLVYTPFYLEQFMGQFSFLMAALIAALLFTPLERAREPLPARALAAWVASLALKSYTVLFALPLLLRRRWRTTAIAAGATAAAVAPYYLARPGDLAYFLRVNLTPFQEGGISGTFGFHAFLKEISLVAFGPPGLRKLSFGVADLAVANVPVILAMLLVLAAALWTTARTRAPLEELLALWVLAFFLSYKEIWEYHYVMLLPVLTLLYVRTGSPLVLAVWAVLALPTPFALYAGSYHPKIGWDLPAGLIHFASKSVPTFALYAWLVRRLLREGRFPTAMPASARTRAAGSVQ